MRRKTFTVIATLILGIAVAPPAAASVSGSVSFHCTAKLPEWPTPQANGVCENGATPALGYAELSGVDFRGAPYVVHGLGAFRAAFEYSSGCIAAEPPLVGNAAGIATISDVPAVHAGIPTVADVHAYFTWVRVGANATILVSGWEIDFATGGIATGTNGAGDATFVAVLTASNACPVGGPLQALVQGEVVAAQ